MGALSGIRVLDLAGKFGAYCGKLLGDMGADVIAIEPPPGEPMRAVGPFLDGAADPNRSLFFWHYAAGKRSVVLDLDSPPDRQRFLALADGADVVLTSGTPVEIARRGLDYASLSAGRPGIIVAAVTGFGLSGPRAGWRSCDSVAQALGGMVYVNGHPGQAPLRGFGPQAYHGASAHAAIGVLLALLARRRDGRGQLVDVSLQESVAATVEHVSGVYRREGRIPARQGTLHWSRDFRVARCRDGSVLQGTLGDWTSLVEWVKSAGKGNDIAGAEWDDFHHRRAHAEKLFDALDTWAGELGVAELADGAQLRRLPFAPVRPLAALPADEQLRARGFFVPVRHDELGRAVVYPGAPYVFGATPWRIRRRPPLLGEHTAEILAELCAPTRGRPAAMVASGEKNAPDGGRRVLEGVRVLDFTWVVAGPVATRILADHGAEVIKVERRNSLDEGGRRGGLTGNLNRGKRSVVVDLSTPRGVELVRALAARSDVVIDNFSARVMANWGLDYPALRGIKPDIIQIAMTGFGLDGPRNDHVSYGPTLQALAGYTQAMGHPEGEPAGWGFSYADMAAGYHAALAALIALWHRERTGEGQLVDLAQFEAVSAAIGPALLDVLVHRRASGPAGNRSPEGPAAPHGVYRCRDAAGDGPARDRWCAICVFDDAEWRRFAAAIGAPDWASHPRFAAVSGRVERQAELDGLVESWTRTRTAEDVMEILQRAGVAAGLVANAEDLCLRDEHLMARGYWAAVPTPEGETVCFDGVTARLSRTPGAIVAPGPLLGEHTDTVLRDVLGLEPAEIDRLRAAGVVA